jgi:hypothetical protein
MGLSKVGTHVTVRWRVHSPESGGHASSGAPSKTGLLWQGKRRWRWAGGLRGKPTEPGRHAHGKPCRVALTLKLIMVEL